jgi:hypothetical protein
MIKINLRNKESAAFFAMQPEGLSISQECPNIGKTEHYLGWKRLMKTWEKLVNLFNITIRKSLFLNFSPYVNT